MRIALINPPHPYLIEPNAQAPLGLAYLSAMIKQHRPDVEVQILNYSHKSIQETIDTIGEFDVYGYTATVVDYFNIVDVVKGIKKRFPNSLNIIGGSHATLSHDQMPMDKFDSVFIGEAEYTILDFIDDVKSNDIKKQYFGATIQDLDKLPFPDREALGIHQGGQIFLEKNNTSTVIMGSRGCPYNCAFCASETLWTRKVRWRSIDLLIEEIKHTQDTLNIHNFRFSDDNMTSNKKRLIEFCKKAKPLNINWRLSARVDSMDDELMMHMHDAGCKEVSLGVESFDINVLRAMNKKITPELSVEAIKRAKKHNIKTRILFMISTPGETYKHTVQENIRYIEQIKNDFDLISLKILVPLPGTAVWDFPKEHGINIICDDFRKFNFYMYENKDGKVEETPIYSNITINSMLREQQLENIREMRKYIETLPQNNKPIKD